MMDRSIWNRRRAGLAFAAVIAAACGSARADEPRAFAAISLVADELSVVGQEASTGSALNRNARQSVPLAFDVVEIFALKALAEAILANDATATVAPVRLSDRRDYDNAADWVAGPMAALPTELLGRLRAGKISHLVIATKHRTEARLDSGMQQFGSGRIQGVGYYVDDETKIRQVGKNEVTTGYLAPFVYIRVSLIDIATLKVIDSVTVVDNGFLTAIGTQVGRDPWDLLDPGQKISTIRGLAKAGIEKAVARLLRTR